MIPDGFSWIREQKISGVDVNANHLSEVLDKSVKTRLTSLPKTLCVYASLAVDVIASLIYLPFIMTSFCPCTSYCTLSLSFKGLERLSQISSALELAMNYLTVDHMTFR